MDPADQPKAFIVYGKFYEADLFEWDIIMGYDFMVNISAVVLPYCATLIRQANERVSLLFTHDAMVDHNGAERNKRSFQVP